MRGIKGMAQGHTSVRIRAGIRTQVLGSISSGRAARSQFFVLLMIYLNHGYNPVIYIYPSSYPLTNQYIHASICPSTYLSTHQPSISLHPFTYHHPPINLFNFPLIHATIHQLFNSPIFSSINHSLIYASSHSFITSSLSSYLLLFLIHPPY
jgi:hypothetical protein